ncbi:hypothetical protein VKT23_018534 [Stygiomarasmius scandens]|uniref:Zn(2)-C6 fungal-type domain-containing protein n=1 Tax=Marasmiellus scandens TaxID=2682957 RepID=A0ABR1IR31_9AGAR
MNSRSRSKSPGIRRRSSLHEPDTLSSTLPPPSTSLATSSTPVHPSTSSSSSQPTPLPSIRSLHPYLPPTAAQHHHPSGLARSPSLRDLHPHSHGSPLITQRHDGARPPPALAAPSMSGSYASPPTYSPYSSSSPRIHPPPHVSPHLVGVAGPGPTRSFSGPGLGGLAAPGHFGSHGAPIGPSTNHPGGGPLSSQIPSTISLSYDAGPGSDGEDVPMEGPVLGVEQLTQHEQPNKKKRRRQALSCTECKRRKIKCDRNQPCSPCTRRGEQAKCQWHVVESISDKYVSRAEYDELRARVDKLEALVVKLTGSDGSNLLEGSGRSDGDGRSGGQSPDPNEDEKNTYGGGSGGGGGKGYGGGSATLGKRRKGDEREEGGGMQDDLGSGYTSGAGFGSRTGLSESGDTKFHLGNGGSLANDLKRRRSSSVACVPAGVARASNPNIDSTRYSLGL